MGSAACATSARPGARLGASGLRLYAELVQMEDARRPDTALIARALHSESAVLRSAAVLAAGRVNVRSSAADLRAVVASSAEPAVAANAAFALGLLRDTAGIPTLATAAGAGDAGVACEAAWALGQIGEPARAAILSALSPSRPDEVTGELLLAASKLRPVPVERIVPFLESDRPDVAAAAAYAIARPRVPAGTRALLRLARSPHPQVREQVARGLGKPAAGDSLGSEARAALELLAQDRVAHVRVNAVTSLATYGRDAATALLAATKDSDPNVRIAAAGTLNAVLPAGPESWTPAWNADTGLTYRIAVLSSAARVGLSPDAFIPAGPGDWSSSVDWRRRAAVASAAGAAPASLGTLRIVTPFLRDRDGRVRAAAVGAVGRLVDSLGQNASVRENVLSALSDADPVVRDAAARALTARASAAEAPRVLAAYRRALTDSITDARIAALRYLARAWRRDSAAFPDSLRAAIALLPPSADPDVRAAASGFPLLAGWGAVAGTQRPLAWYEQRVRELVLPALAGRLPKAILDTERGVIELDLYALDAPLTVDNFISLARRGFYDSGRFHRVVPNFVAQDGDPRGDGSGGPGYAIRDELNRRRYDRGVLGMALSGPNTGGSQYFITLSPQPHLDGGYTVFGRVTAGFAALDALVQGDQIRTIRIR